MKAKSRFRLCGWGVLLIAILAQSQTTPIVSGPTASKHRSGPGGLEGWTLSYVISGDTESYPEILVIARKGQILRKIKGDPFIWSWMFLKGERQVAYETGPLHGEVSCILADLSTGRQLADYDCYHELPPDTPSWVNELLNSH